MLLLESNGFRNAQLHTSPCGRPYFRIGDRTDHSASYRRGLYVKHGARLPLDPELREGDELLQHCAECGDLETIATCAPLIEHLQACQSVEEQVVLWSAAQIGKLLRLVGSCEHLVRNHEYPLEVGRPLTRLTSWYELSLHSESGSPIRHGTLDGVTRRLSQIAAVGFDALYFPPTHPISRTYRRGYNSSLCVEAGNLGSLYVIGSEEDGHKAICLELGGHENFRRLFVAVHEHGMELALDFAIQCFLDRPRLHEHLSWFARRPDGNPRYAENPPEKYEDTVNVGFYAEQALPNLRETLRDVVLGWAEQGVMLFHVDNPYTKPLPFWEWPIAEVCGRHLQVTLLSGASIHSTMVARLGKTGFSQSYTYFTWRNDRRELTEYFAELNQSPWHDHYRPNFFINTLDISPWLSQNSGRPGFLVRAVLAIMNLGLWGAYFGSELYEVTALPGEEEYLDSEKYQLRPHDYQAPDNIVTGIARLNHTRWGNPVLQTHPEFQTYSAWNDRVLHFGKRAADLADFALAAVCLDPHEVQEARFGLPLRESGLSDDASFQGEDLMNGYRWAWHGKVRRMCIES